MNSLSWFLYFAGISEGLQGLLIVGGFVFLIVAGFVAANFSSEKEKTPSWNWAIVALGLFSIFVGCFVPNKNTLYAIAASELGEEVIKSNIGTKVSQALEQWIDKQLEQKK